MGSGTLEQQRDYFGALVRLAAEKQGWDAQEWCVILREARLEAEVSFTHIVGAVTVVHCLDDSFDLIAEALMLLAGLREG